MTDSSIGIDGSREVLGAEHSCSAAAKDTLSGEAVHAVNGPLATALLSVQLAIRLLPEKCDMRVEKHLNRVADCIRFASSVAQGFNTGNARSERAELTFAQEGRNPVGILTHKKGQVTLLEFALANFLSDVLSLHPVKCTASTAEAADSFSIRFVIHDNPPHDGLPPCQKDGHATKSSLDAYDSAYVFPIVGMSHLSSFTAAREVGEQHRAVMSICIQR